MGQISSINFKKSTDFQPFHNANIRPDYAIGGNIIVNRNGYEARDLKNQIIADAKEAYRRFRGQKSKPNLTSGAQFATSKKQRQCKI